MRRTSLFLAATLLAAMPAAAQTKIVFGTNWLAQGEQGGFYQALAKGFYRRHGLDVTIRMGGPGVNPSLLVASGITDFQLSPSSFGALNLVKQNIPVLAVAAFFQKDPDVLIAHAGAGNDTLAGLRGKPIMISATARDGFWLFLRARYGFCDSQIRPYNFAIAPFLADRSAIQQGYITAEPIEIARQTGEQPVVHLLADSGYTSYGNLVLTTAQRAAEQPATVAAFVEASAEGWVSFLHEAPEPAIALITAANHDMTREAILAARDIINRRGLVEAGAGVGTMTTERWHGFFETMVEQGIYPADLPWQHAFSLDFVGQTGRNTAITHARLTSR